MYFFCVFQGVAVRNPLSVLVQVEGAGAAEAEVEEKGESKNIFGTSHTDRRTAPCPSCESGRGGRSCLQLLANWEIQVQQLYRVGCTILAIKVRCTSAFTCV